MKKFYVSRVFNNGDKYTIGNWLEYEGEDAFAACDKIWQQFLADTSDKFNFSPRSSSIAASFNMISASFIALFCGEIA